MTAPAPDATEKTAPDARWLRDPGHLLALGFGSGLAPRAPGTFGSLAALPLAWGLLQLPLALQLLLVGAAIVLGIWICGRCARALGTHDHGAIVWDEFAGLWLALLGMAPTLPNLVLGFALFRLFDIAKPWPISWADRRVHGGLGTMLDDLLAGALAWLSLNALLWLW